MVVKNIVRSVKNKKLTGSSMGQNSLAVALWLDCGGSKVSSKSREIKKAYRNKLNNLEFADNYHISIFDSNVDAVSRKIYRGSISQLSEVLKSKQTNFSKKAVFPMKLLSEIKFRKSLSKAKKGIDARIRNYIDGFLVPLESKIKNANSVEDLEKVFVSSMSEEGYKLALRGI